MPSGVGRMKEETTYGLNPVRLARLLAVGLENSDGEGSLRASETSAEVLRGMLAGKLPLDPAMPDSLPAVLNWRCEEVLALPVRQWVIFFWT